MKCPYCKQNDSRVIDSRSADDGANIRRRREVFKRDKILNGIIRACDKRDISLESITGLVNDIERDIRNTMEQEVPAAEIGKLVMSKLKHFDEVAYIRFASVYRKFADISSFMEELRELQAHKGEQEKDKL